MDKSNKPRVSSGIILILLFVCIFYFRSLSTFFVQDDFWLLSISHIRSVADFLLFFLPRVDAIWYRPLSSQVFFFFGRLFFGLNPLLFHIVVLITHLMTVYLLYRLVQKIHHNQHIAYIAAALYGLHQIHTVSLSWLATYSFVLGPFFLVLLLLAYERKNYRWAVFFLLLGLLTSEVMVIVPLILLTREWVLHRQIKLVGIMSYMMLSVFVLWLRFIIFPTAVKTSLYQVAVTPQLASLIKFYLLQLIGLPMLVSTMPLWLRLFTYVLSIFLTGLVVFGVWATIKKNTFRFLAFWVGISFLGILPFLFLPGHLAPHYMTFALIGVAPLLANLIVEASQLIGMKQQRFFLLIVAGMFLGLHFIASRWTYETHWIFRRAKLAEELVEKKDLIHTVGSEEYFSLSGNNAMEVFTQ